MFDLAQRGWSTRHLEHGGKVREGRGAVTKECCCCEGAKNRSITSANIKSSCMQNVNGRQAIICDSPVVSSIRSVLKDIIFWLTCSFFIISPCERTQTVLCAVGHALYVHTPTVDSIFLPSNHWHNTCQSCLWKTKVRLDGGLPMLSDFFFIVKAKVVWHYYFHIGQHHRRLIIL